MHAQFRRMTMDSSSRQWLKVVSIMVIRLDFIHFNSFWRYAQFMLRRLSISLAISIGLSITGIQVVAAEDLSAKLLDIPMIDVKTGGLPKSSNGKVDLTFYEPYSVEFSGTQAMKYSTCDQLVDGINGLETTWTTAGISEKKLIKRNLVLYTIGITKTGIQCALARRSDTWSDTYNFAAGEQSVPMTIAISFNGSKLAEKTGILRNPDFAQSAPGFVGLSRGDVVNGFAKFKFSGVVPPGPFLNPPEVTLCPIDTDGHDCGWGYINENNEGVIIANPISYGKTATLSVIWSYTNSAGADVRTKSELIGLTVQKNTDPIPWNLITPLQKLSTKISHLFLDANIECNPASSLKSDSISCKGNPSLDYSDSFGSVIESQLHVAVMFDIKSRADGCLEKNSDAVSAVTGKTATFVFKNLGKPKYSVRIQILSPFDIWPNSFSDKELKNKVFLDVGTQSPDYQYYGKGAKCHEVFPPKVSSSKRKVDSTPVDKSSNAYKTMYSVGQNFAKVSTASDTANSQCNSALQTGMIRSNGIPKYLGPQATSIQSYLQTSSGFQGCLDGFGH